MKLLDAETARLLDSVAKHYRASKDDDGDLWYTCPDEWRTDEFLVPLAVRAVKQLELRGETLRTIGRWDANLAASLVSDEYYYGVSMEDIIEVFERMIEVHYERLESADG